jgi:hypothetical protein
MRFLLPVFALFLFSFSAQAKVTNEQRIFISQFNQMINQYGRSSNLEVAYKDAVWTQDPKIGNYFTLKSPSIRHLAGGVDYTLSMRNLALFEQGDGVWRLSIPASGTLTVLTNGRSHVFDVSLNGVPTMVLKGTQSYLSHYQIEAPEFVAISLRSAKQSASTGLKGKVSYEGSSFAQPAWTALSKIEPGKVSAFFRALKASVVPQSKAE